MVDEDAEGVRGGEGRSHSVLVKVYRYTLYIREGLHVSAGVQGRGDGEVETTATSTTTTTWWIGNPLPNTTAVVRNPPTRFS